MVGGQAAASFGKAVQIGGISGIRQALQGIVRLYPADPGQGDGGTFHRQGTQGLQQDGFLIGVFHDLADRLAESQILFEASMGRSRSTCRQPPTPAQTRPDPAPGAVFGARIRSITGHARRALDRGMGSQRPSALPGRTVRQAPQPATIRPFSGRG